MTGRWATLSPIPALVRGGFLPDDERAALAEEVGRWAGVSADFIDDLVRTVRGRLPRRSTARSQLIVSTLACSLDAAAPCA